MSDMDEGPKKKETPAVTSSKTVTQASTTSPAAATSPSATTSHGMGSTAAGATAASATGSPAGSTSGSTTGAGGQQSSEKAAADMAAKADANVRSTEAKADRDARELADEAKRTASSVAADARAAAAETGAAAKERAGELAAKARSEAAQMTEQAKETARAQAEGYKSAAASEVSKQADALRSAGREFGEDSYQARAADYLADGLSEAATVIRDRDFATMAEDVNGFARRNPALFLGGAAVLGFVAARLMKASERDHPEWRYADDHAPEPYAPAYPDPYAERMASPAPGVRNTPYDTTTAGGASPSTADTGTIGSTTSGSGRVNGAAK